MKRVDLETIQIHSFAEESYFIKNLVKVIADYETLFSGVLVHGSVATNEVISYSDFDGLLIVKDEFIDSNRLEEFKKKTFKIILEFDPLQHHGWFQIKESDLQNYPEASFPVEILNYCKLIFPNKPYLELKLKVNDEVDYNYQLIGMLQNFEKRNLNNWRPKNLYQLKSFLSEIMLFPSLYYSAIYRKGIFKKESFEKVKKNFTIEEWYPIATATLIRKDWSYELNYFQKLIMSRPERLFRKLTEKFVAPDIPQNVERIMDHQFYQSLEKLVLKIRKEIS